VHDGEEAWFKGSTEQYGAIVLDLGLPKLDGLTLMKRWRAEGIETPILVLSGRGTWRSGWMASTVALTTI